MTTREPFLGVRSVEKPPKRAGRYFAVMRYEHRLMAVALCCIAFAGCRKEAATHPPVVTIVAPGNGFNLSIPDTLHVVADVSGEEDIEEVHFSIKDVNGLPVIEPFQIAPTGNPARLEVSIPIISDLIASGDYTLTVQANAGEAHGKDQADLDISGTPLRLRRLFAIGRPDAGSVSIHIIDSTGAVSLANTLLMDLGGGGVSSAARTFVISGSVQGPLMAFAPEGVQVRWQKPNLGNSGIPWFTSLDIGEDGRYYVGMSDGTLRGYNATSGVAERIFDLLPGLLVRSSTIVDDRMVTAQVDQSGSAWRLGIYQAASGALIAEQAVDMRVAFMFRRNGAQVLLFGDRDGHGAVRDHSIADGGGWEPYSWDSGIAAVERVDANTFLVALMDGTLERFTWSNAGSIPIADLPEVRDLSLDPVSGLVYVAAGTSVLAVNPQNGQIASSQSMGAPMYYVLPLLNR